MSRNIYSITIFLILHWILEISKFDYKSYSVYEVCENCRIWKRSLLNVLISFCVLGEFIFCFWLFFCLFLWLVGFEIFVFEICCSIFLLDIQTQSVPMCTWKRGNKSSRNSRQKQKYRLRQPLKNTTYMFSVSFLYFK